MTHKNKRSKTASSSVCRVNKNGNYTVINFNLLSSLLSDFDEIHDDFRDKLDCLFSEKERYEASKRISVIRKDGDNNG